MTNFNFPVSNTVLLTGAGFTHNFGGFLANGMWAEIHNRFQRYYHGTEESRLLKEIKREFNYEELYQSIDSNREYTDQEKDSFTKAVLQAYETLDEVVRSKKYIHSDNIDKNSIVCFLSRLKNSNNHHAFFFTLNQDILVERFFTDGINAPVLPGLIINDIRFNNSQDKPLESIDYATVLKDKKLETARTDLKTLGRLYYIKLHGSYDWRDEQNQAKMIIGTNKPDQIKKDPILSWYFQLFKDVLSLHSRRLLIIGYGFGDRHINEVIADATKNHNLKIYIISPQDPKEFREKTLRINDAISEKIWNAVSGYYPYTLEGIFCNSPNASPLYQNLIKDFFRE